MVRVWLLQGTPGKKSDSRIKITSGENIRDNDRREFLQDYKSNFVSLMKKKKKKKIAKGRVDHTYKTKRISMICHSFDLGAKSSSMERAEEIAVYVGEKFPTFVKSMIRSQVSGGYWMGLPRDFCLVHMPMSDAGVTLVDENGEEYETKYLAERTGLSGGWRKFAIQHRLLEKDAMVFHLIEPSKFKVYILREHFSSVADGALALMNLAYSK